jgi:hypothetical protein
VGHGIAARWGRASRVPLLPCLSACLPVCLSACRFSASVLPSSTLPCCHVPFTPPPVVLPPVFHFPHPLLNPGCFLSPSVFRTRTHERPRPRGPLLSFRAGCFVSASHCYRRRPLHRSRAAEGSRIQMKNMSRDPRVSSPFCDKMSQVWKWSATRGINLPFWTRRHGHQSPLSFFVCYPTLSRTRTFLF